MKTWMLAAIIATGVVLPTASASAATNAPQLWAAGNGVAIANILTAVKGFLAEGSYTHLIEMVGIGAFMFTAVSATLLQVKPQQIILFFITFALILTVTFRGRMAVTVHDPVNQYTQVVTDVPLVVAFPATLISSIGHYLLQGVETFFSYPSQFGAGSSRLSLERSGQFNLMAQMVHDASVVKIQDPHIRASLHSYTEDCVVPMLYNGTLDIKTLKKSTHLWQTVKNPNQAMLTTYYSDTYPQGDIRTCPSAHTAIKKDFANSAPGLVGAAFSSFKYTNAVDFFRGAYSDAQTYLTGNSSPATTNELLRNNAVINSFMGAADDVTTTMGDTSGLPYALNSAKAEASQKTGWQIAANIFQRVMGYLYTVMQAFIIAIIPFALVAFIIPSYGTKVAGSVFKVMVWLALWQPLLGVVNFIIASFLKQGVGGIITNGVTMGNIGALTLASQNASLAASMFATSIPLISWGLVSGGQFAITQFLAEGAGAVQAKQAAQETASGNASADQVSLSNTRNNDNRMVHAFSFGQMNPELNEHRGLNVLQHGGGMTGDYASRQIQVTRTLANTSENARGAGHTRTAGDSASARSAGSLTRSHQEVLKDDFQAGTGVTGGQHIRAGRNTSMGQNARTSTEAGTHSRSDIKAGSGDSTRAQAGVNLHNLLGGMSSKKAGDTMTGAASAHLQNGRTESEVADYIGGRAKQYEASGGNSKMMLNTMKNNAERAGGKSGARLLTALNVLDARADQNINANESYDEAIGSKTSRDSSFAQSNQTGVQQNTENQRQDMSKYLRSFAQAMVDSDEMRAEDSGAFVKDMSDQYATTQSVFIKNSEGRHYTVPGRNAGLDQGESIRSNQDKRAENNLTRYDHQRGKTNSEARENWGAADANRRAGRNPAVGISPGDRARFAHNVSLVKGAADASGQKIFGPEERERMEDVKEGVQAANRFTRYETGKAAADAISSSDPIGTLWTNLKGEWSQAHMAIKRGIASMDGMTDAERGKLERQYTELNKSVAEERGLPNSSVEPGQVDGKNDQKVPREIADFLDSYHTAAQNSMEYDRRMANRRLESQGDQPIFNNVDHPGTALDTQNDTVTVGQPAVVTHSP